MSLLLPMCLCVVLFFSLLVSRLFHTRFAETVMLMFIYKYIMFVSPRTEIFHVQLYYKHIADVASYCTDNVIDICLRRTHTHTLAHVIFVNEYCECTFFKNMAHCIRASYAHKNLLSLYYVVVAAAAAAERVQHLHCFLFRCMNIFTVAKTYTWLI